MSGQETFWTLQHFCMIVGRPWYALQQQSDGGVERQFTGYRSEMDAVAAVLRVVPEELLPTKEDGFFAYFDNL